VAYYGAGHVKIYGSDGVPLTGGELSSAGTLGNGGEACGVAVDAQGHLYVSLANGYINKYTPTANGVSVADYSSSLSGDNGSGEACNIAVDEAENVYVDTYGRRFGHTARPITKYEPSQFSLIETGALGTAIDGVGGSTLAVESTPAADNLYVDEEDHVAQYGVSAIPELVGKLGGSGAAELNGSHGIAVNSGALGTTSGYIYVSDGLGHVQIFGPTRPQAPGIESESVLSVGAREATLEAEINPSLADTHYHFE